MLRAQRQSNRAQKANTVSLPAPVGGWNARDPLANMSPSDAIILDNWFPRPSDVLMRAGCTDWATGLPNQVNSLLVYAGPNSSSLFAASGSGIYDVSTQGAVGSPIYSGLNSTKFNYVNFRTAGGQFLWAVNGTDLALLYNGTSWANPAVTGLGSLTTADFNNINIWKNRIFLVQKNSLSVWYLPINSIAGAASEINFGPLFKSGGEIVALATWTIDGGYGMDDHLVVITSKGEIAVYRGTDPSSAADFALIGIYQVGAPIGDQCFLKYGGDLIVTTLDGFLPMSSVLQSTRVDNRVAISNKICGAVTQATSLYQNNFGWDSILFSKENMLLFNIPVNEGIESHQYVMNTLTNAWCRFKGWNANCFELFQDNLYFGTFGKVCLAFSGTSDSGSDITSTVKTAFNNFGDDGKLKQWKMLRPIFTADETPAPSIGLNIDFADVDVTYAISVSNPAARWDVALWDAAVWPGISIYKDWQSVSGLGYWAAFRMNIVSDSITISWASIDYLFEVGGIL